MERRCQIIGQYRLALIVRGATRALGHVPVVSDVHPQVTEGWQKTAAAVVSDWHPWHLDDPDPHPWLVDTVRLVGALTLASVGSRVAEGSAREALGQGAERLLASALAGGQGERLQEPALAN